MKLCIPKLTYSLMHFIEYLTVAANCTSTHLEDGKVFRRITSWNKHRNSCAFCQMFGLCFFYNTNMNTSQFRHKAVLIF